MGIQERKNNNIFKCRTEFQNKILLVLSFLNGSVNGDNKSVISFIRFQSQLFLWFEFLFLEFLDFTSKNGSRVNGRIDTRGLDGDDRVTAVFEEHVGVDTDDTGLIGLSDVGEYDIDHADEHAVFVGVTGVFDDGDDVGAFFGDVDEIAAGTVGEFDGVDAAGLFVRIKWLGEGG